MASYNNHHYHYQHNSHSPDLNNGSSESVNNGSQFADSSTHLASSSRYNLGQTASPQPDIIMMDTSTDSKLVWDGEKWEYRPDPTPTLLALQQQQQFQQQQQQLLMQQQPGVYYYEGTIQAVPPPIAHIPVPIQVPSPVPSAMHITPQPSPSFMPFPPSPPERTATEPIPQNQQQIAKCRCGGHCTVFCKVGKWFDNTRVRKNSTSGPSASPDPGSSSRTPFSASSISLAGPPSGVAFSRLNYSPNMGFGTQQPGHAASYVSLQQSISEDPYVSSRRSYSPDQAKSRSFTPEDNPHGRYSPEMLRSFTPEDAPPAPFTPQRPVVAPRDLVSPRSEFAHPVSVPRSDTMSMITPRVTNATMAAVSPPPTLTEHESETTPEQFGMSYAYQDPAAGQSTVPIQSPVSPATGVGSPISPNFVPSPTTPPKTTEVVQQKQRQSEQQIAEESTPRERQMPEMQETKQRTHNYPPDIKERPRTATPDGRRTPTPTPTAQQVQMQMQMQQQKAVQKTPPSPPISAEQSTPVRPTADESDEIRSIAATPEAYVRQRKTVSADVPRIIIESEFDSDDQLLDDDSDSDDDDDEGDEEKKSPEEPRPTSSASSCSSSSEDSKPSTTALSHPPVLRQHRSSINLSSQRLNSPTFDLPIRPSSSAGDHSTTSLLGDQELQFPRRRAQTTNSMMAPQPLASLLFPDSDDEEDNSMLKTESNLLANSAQQPQQHLNPAATAASAEEPEDDEDAAEAAAMMDPMVFDFLQASDPEHWLVRARVAAELPPPYVVSQYDTSVGRRSDPYVEMDGRAVPLGSI
jgi:hypothetical protein